MLVDAAILHFVKRFVVPNTTHISSITCIFSLNGPTFRWLPWCRVRRYGLVRGRGRRLRRKGLVDPIQLCLTLRRMMQHKRFWPISPCYACRTSRERISELCGSVYGGFAPVSEWVARRNFVCRTCCDRPSLTTCETGSASASACNNTS
jgi:hypothetical protein